MQIKAKMACKEKIWCCNIFKLGDYIKQKNKEKHNGLHHTQTEEFKEKYLYGEKNREYIDGRSQDEDRRKISKRKSLEKEKSMLVIIILVNVVEMIKDTILMHIIYYHICNILNLDLMSIMGLHYVKIVIKNFIKYMEKEILVKKK